MELGNHTFSHKDFHKVTCKVFFDDIIKGEKLTKVLLPGRSPRYFRHPYLHIGDSEKKADSLRGFLTSNGYTEAPVTIDNSDWIFTLAYDSALSNKDTALMKTIGTEYLRYMEQKLKYYENISSKIFGRNIKHILLVHSNSINADYLDALATMYEKSNYSFISLSGALGDSAYRTKITVYKNWGISWIDRWALSMGKKGKFFNDDPETPAYIMKLANITQE